MTARNITPVELPTRRDADHPFDPPAELGPLQAERPIVRMLHQDGYVGWLVTNQFLARTMLADPRFSARPELRRVAVGSGGGSLMGEAAPGEFINMDRPEHTRYRRLLTRHFTEPRLKRLETYIEQTVAEHLDALERSGPPADLVQDFALPVPSLVISELLGVPAAHRAQVLAKSTQLAYAGTPEARGAGLLALARYLRKLVLHKRTHRGPDLLGVLAADDALSDEELANVAVGLVLGGHETTANMIALGIFALLKHPDQLAALRADPSLIDSAIEELLRYLTITHLGLPYRAALEDVELGGELIREGETVTVALPIVNRDPEYFAEADRLQLDRTDSRRHLAFGYGAHQCLGQHLARIELRIAYLALLERFPRLHLTVPAADIPMRESAFIYGPLNLPVAWAR